jgi:hypothetical protein
VKRANVGKSQKREFPASQRLEEVGQRGKRAGNGLGKLGVLNGGGLLTCLVGWKAATLPAAVCFSCMDQRSSSPGMRCLRQGNGDVQAGTQHHVLPLLGRMFQGWCRRQAGASDNQRRCRAAPPYVSHSVSPRTLAASNASPFHVGQAFPFGHHPASRKTQMPVGSKPVSGTKAQKAMMRLPGGRGSSGSLVKHSQGGPG